MPRFRIAARAHAGKDNLPERGFGLEDRNKIGVGEKAQQALRLTFVDAKQQETLSPVFWILREYCTPFRAAKFTSEIRVREQRDDAMRLLQSRVHHGDKVFVPEIPILEDDAIAGFGQNSGYENCDRLIGPRSTDEEIEAAISGCHLNEFYAARFDSV